MLLFGKFDFIMNLSSSSRLIAALFTLVSLLFMQLAVAAYVCPVMPKSTGQLSLGTSVQMPCHQMDQDQPTLCRVHASDASSKLSLDKPGMPDVHAFVPVRMAQSIGALPFVPRSKIARVGFLTTRSHPPPVAILHCCFRI